jgi:hypothetical protein
VPLVTKCQQIQDSYGDYTPDMYRKKLRTAFFIWQINNFNLATYVVKSGLEFFKMDASETFVAWMRGFGDQDSFLAKFRFKPCASILSMIIKRTKTYTAEQHQQKLTFISEMATELKKMGYFIPGQV